jgi:hypothetical protein
MKRLQGENQRSGRMALLSCIFQIVYRCNSRFAQRLMDRFYSFWPMQNKIPGLYEGCRLWNLPLVHGVFQLSTTTGAKWVLFFLFLYLYYSLLFLWNKASLKQSSKSPATERKEGCLRFFYCWGVRPVKEIILFARIRQNLFSYFNCDVQALFPVF